MQLRLDEYALRYTPWKEGQFSFQIGKFGSIVGNWIPRHLSWENPFITAPVPYEVITKIEDKTAPFPGYLTQPGGIVDEKYEYLPSVIWGPSYASGVSVSGRLGKIEYAAELKNSSLASRPESWHINAIGFENPTVSTRLGFRPNQMWNFGFSASDGAYFRPEAQPTLPMGRDIGDYHQRVLAQDIGFAWRHFQFWAEFFEARYEVPGVGDADLFAYYLEAKYKFTPQFFGAVRWNQQFFADVPDLRRGGRAPWGHDLWRADLAAGYRFTPHTQLKIQYNIEHEKDIKAALAHKVFYGPVYFRRGTEPFMTLAMAGSRRDAGVSVAEVNLTHIWDVVNQIRVGRNGRAYVVDAQGRLIAHPEISLVLRNTDFSQLAQVKSARAQAGTADIEQAQMTRDWRGEPRVGGARDSGAAELARAGGASRE